jgi:tetratricopeptide (TPR) repeat protein
MRAPRNLFFLALAFAIISVCSAQGNQDPIQRDKVSMHNAMIKGDTETMKILLDSGSVKMDEWVGFGNIQTWVEDACWSGSPVALEYLLQRGADTLRADTANPHFPKLRPSNALGWCVGDSSMTFISSDGGSTTRPLGRGDVDSAKVFRIFIKYFEQQVNKTTDPGKTLNEQVAMAGGTGPLIWSAVGNQYDDVCLEKVTWLVESGQDITKLERRDNWQTLLDNRSKTNPTCVAYLRNELEKKGSGRTINPPQTERREPSTEQRTGAANMELGRLARQANGLSADQASRLEESLIHDPNDLAARAQLLGYYFAASPRLSADTVHEARVRHILWLVQNHPESELAGMSEATIDPAGGSLADRAGYEKVKALWLEQVKSHPDKVMVLVNAAWFFKLPDKAIAASLLTRAHAVDPSNQNASAGLGIVYAAAIVGLTGMNQNRFPTEAEPEEARGPFTQKAREELNKSGDAEVIGTAGYYLNFWGGILNALGKAPTDYDDLAEKCLAKAQALDPGNPEWARDLASLYELRAMKAKSPEERTAILRKRLENLEKAQALSKASYKSVPADSSDLANAAFDAGEFEQAEVYARKALTLASQNRSDPYYGEALNRSNAILGRVALHAGDVEKAKSFLIAAGQTPQGTKVDSLPDMHLAKELLEQGQRQTVLDYLEACKGFWNGAGSPLDGWIETIKSGGTPKWPFIASPNVKVPAVSCSADTNPVLCSDKTYSVSFRLPENWSVKSSWRWGDRENTVHFNDSQKISEQTGPSLYYRSRVVPLLGEPAGIQEELQKEMESKVGQRHAQHIPTYHLLPESCEARRVGGHDARSCLAEFTSELGTPMAEYLTLVRTENTLALFFGFIPAKDLDSYRKRLDTIIETLQIP